MCPLGQLQQRSFHGPRNQRSRSADVDRLKKYAERIEERRKTVGDEEKKITPSRSWVPLSVEKRRMASLEAVGSIRNKQPTERSLSADTQYYSQEQRQTKARRHTEYSYDKMLSFRWYPIPRFGDNKPLNIEINDKKSASIIDKKDTTKWPLRKCSTQAVKNDDTAETIDKTTRLSQRIRELYDFKTDIECPKRLSNASSGYSWTKNSREASKDSLNNQELEYKDRITRLTRQHHNDNQVTSDDDYSLRDLSKKTDDASYLSIGKRGSSIESKPSEKMVDLPPRRALSQSTDDRPSTPLPELINQNQPSKLMILRQKRKSTTFKVYLT